MVTTDLTLPDGIRGEYTITPAMFAALPGNLGQALETLETAIFERSCALATPISIETFADLKNRGLTIRWYPTYGR